MAHQPVILIGERTPAVVPPPELSDIAADDTVDSVAVARLYGEPLFALPHLLQLNI